MTLDLAPEAESDRLLTLENNSFLPYVEQDIEDEPYYSGVFRNFAAVEAKIAPANTKEALHFLHVEDVQNDSSWYRKCLSLQRQARGLPAVYPTAMSAALATPESERVYKKEDLRRGMVAYCYNPDIPGTAGHIFAINGGRKSGGLLTTTNDAEAAGYVSVVPFEFYERVWGHKFQFGATCLNGYDFSDFNKAPEPIHQGTLGERYEKAIDDLQRIERKKRNNGLDKLADAIHRDIVRMQRKLERWG